MKNKNTEKNKNTRKHAYKQWSGHGINAKQLWKY